MTAFFRRFAVWTVLFLCITASVAFAQGMKMPVYPALTQNKDWLNTARPLTEADLKGRILLVDFWTYCCINCMHVIPKLQELEHEFGDKLTVIGVHSAKFSTEGETDSIREAIQKYGIEHPVINDADFRVWNAFGINAWPTVLLIAPNGLLKNVYKGEGDIAQMRSDIAEMIKKTPDAVTAALPLALEKNKEPPTLLRFPTKMAMKDKNILVISDSGHHRIVLADLGKRKVIATIGKGTKGFADGDLQTAQFNSPQGVLADGNFIYVADTGNHRLRRIDLLAKTVDTLAGTGERGGDFLLGSADALKTALASPWDLAFYPDADHILIANAGSHQLWSYNLADKSLSIQAGNGQESIGDGSLPLNSLAQPSGLSVLDDKVYFTDAETSSLRVYDGKEINTLIGTGLFDFGLKDGDRKTALMQHDTGLVATADGIYVADTYNHAIRKYKDGQLTTLPVKGLKEPNAVIQVGEELYVADTNNHRIVSINKNGDMKTVDLMMADKQVDYQNSLPNPLPSLRQSIGNAAAIRLALPDRWHINPLAPSYLALFDAQQKLIASFEKKDLQTQEINLTGLDRDKTYTLQGIVYYCEDKEGSQCLIRGVDMKLTTNGDSDTISQVKIDFPQ